MEIPVLFQKKEDCCGCGACLNICPKQAIKMQEDKCGFIYPVINEQECIRCGQCKKVCAFQNKRETNTPIECYAAISKDEEQSRRSASAGIFAAIASEVIKNGGIVYGAAFDESWKVHHVSAETLDQLSALQGSKYAHSDIERIYTDVRSQLNRSRNVLFSGTPCQVAGLYGYLGKDYDNLLTIDIVCHGVPSNKMLRDYLDTLEKKHGGKVESFTFRDKTIGWGINGSAVINGKRIKIWQSSSSYLYYFTRGLIYRENCYRCPYACEHRPADITLGDFWGIEKQHPELLGKGKWDERKGISLVIVNSQKAMRVVGTAKIEIRISSFYAMACNNEQLIHPSSISGRGNSIEEYINNGHMFFESLPGNKLALCMSFVKSIMPNKLKRLIKQHK